MLKLSVNHRLTVAAEEEMILLKEEKDRQQKLLDSVFNPELHRADVHQLMVKEEEVLPEQQERSSSLKQENPAEPAHIKDEQVEVGINQEREQLQEPEEDEIIKVIFFPVTVTSEEGDEGKLLPFQLDETQNEENRGTEHLGAEADGEDCGGSELDRDFNSHSYLHPVSPDETSNHSGSDTDDSADWKESDQPQKGSNPQQNKDRAVSDLKCNTGDTTASSIEFAQRTRQEKQPKKQKENHKGGKKFICSVCGKGYLNKKTLNVHLQRHSGEKPYNCSICEKSYVSRVEIVAHMRVHTGEKPFVCSVCGKAFNKCSNVKAHMTVHTGEKPFSCDVCGKSFSQSGHLKQHAVVHNGEKPFSCSVCGKAFTQRGTLNRHLTFHRGDRPFSCSLCDKSFKRSSHLKQHMNVHTRK